jgi:hypothetical protein
MQLFLKFNQLLYAKHGTVMFMRLRNRLLIGPIDGCAPLHIISPTFLHWKLLQRLIIRLVKK